MASCKAGLNPISYRGGGGAFGIWHLAFGPDHQIVEGHFNLALPNFVALIVCTLKK